MTNKKSTKKALFMSALSLLLCFSMLVGTTFAWFTDSVGTVNNVITAGNLDIELYYKNSEAKDWTLVDSNTNIFKDSLWEPGHTEVVYLKVKNAGTLALQYDLGINIDKETTSVNVNGEAFKLSDYILYNVTNGVTEFDNSAAARGDETGKKLNTPYGTAATLEAGKEVTLTMVVFMPTTVGNEANYDKNYAALGFEKPVINLGINLFATQFTKEEDSYGKDYDADALVCDILAKPETINEILATAKPGTVIGLAAGNYGTITLTQNDLTLVSNSAVVDFVDLNEMDNIVIDGLTFNAANAQTAYDAKDKNTGIHKDSGFVASISDGKLNNGGSVGVVIKNCTFTNTSGIATVAATEYIPVYFGDTGRANRSSNITIENCKFLTNAKQYIAMNGIDAGEVIIKNNIFGGNNYSTGHNIINATSQNSNWTVVGNKFYNWNTEKTAIGSSRNGSHIITWTVANNEFFNEDGAVVMALKTSYKDANTVINFTNNTAMMGYSALVATPVNAENEAVFGGMKIQMDKPVTIVETPEDLRAALKNGGVVILDENVVTTDAESNGYGATGLNVNGGVLDGNGMIVKVDGATSTWDSAIAINGGTIKNLTVAKGFRGIFIKNGTEKVYLENVIVDGPTYTISCDQAGKQGIEATNCTFNGWTSYAGTIGSAKFIDCKFGAGAGYNFSRPYAPTEYIGCDFAEGHRMDARAAVTFENCTINGQPLTAENLATLVTGNIGNATVK